jgi:hypothetical protein
MAEQSKSEHPQNLLIRVDRAILEIEEKLKGKGWIEIGIVALVSIAVAVIFGRFARGGPNSSDITMYLNLGMNGIKMPFVLNRYFHIFMQQIFVGLAPIPLEGYHAFWGFLVGLNTFMVYVAGRKLRPNNTILHGVLAVMFFFAMSVMGEVSGVIVVDLTAMTMMMAFFMIYVLSMNNGHANPWLVAALGFVFYLAFKTKETTTPVAVLFLGLGWVGAEGFRWRNLLKNALWVACGFVGGVVFFGILSWIILGDPLYGLRIREWQEFLNTYAVYSSRVLDTLNSLGDGNIDDWYQGYWFEITLLPFLFYLISGIKDSKDAPVTRKMLYMVPLAYVVFMLLSINNRLGYELRFGLPVLPVLSALAPQFIDLNPPKGAGSRLLFWGVMGIGLVVVFGVRLVLRWIAPSMTWDLGAVITLMYYPLLLTALFVSLIMFHDRAYWHLVNFLVVFSLLISPMASNYRAMFVVRENEVRFTEVIKPLMDFEPEINFSPEMRFYATSTTFEQAQLRIIKHRDELMAIFNVLFDASATRENFTYAEAPQDIPGDIVTKGYDYVLMTDDEWVTMLEDETGTLRVREAYRPMSSPNGGFVLLTPLD